MNILGIMWEENSTAALMQDGEVVACASEERFSRIKNDERYPKHAIDYVLKYGNVKSNQIDKVAFVGKIWSPNYILTRRYSTSKVEDSLKEQHQYWYPKLYKNKEVDYLEVFKDKIDRKQYPGNWHDVFKFVKKEHSTEDKINFFQNFRKKTVSEHLKINPDKIVFLEHHQCHAHYAYFGSPIRGKALVLTADAWGDNVNATISTVNNGELKRIYEFDRFILGRLYRYITLFLGMKPNEHEYKVMGLAPYAKEKYFQKALEIFAKTQFVKDISFHYKIVPKDLYFYFKEKLEGQRFDNVAGAIQKYTENLLTKWVTNIMKKTGIYRICFAGGTAMNVKAIMEINNMNSVEEIFICPSPSDESTAIGATYFVMAAYCKDNKLNADKILKPFKHAYLGPEITNEEIDKLIRDRKLDKQYTIKRKVEPSSIAKLLVKGKIIGRAAGRSEFGARALGNRSILADPRNSDVIKLINEKVKNRDFWMPFAATILEKRAKDYFINYKKIGSPYMTIAFNTTLLARKDLKAGLHPADFTCRPQVLQSGTNSEYEKIILEFEKITKVGGLLNTSFNLHGEPIVQTVEDAFRVFKLSNIDALLLNNTLIEKIGY